jgi:glycerol 3-phosphatase-2
MVGTPTLAVGSGGPLSAAHDVALLDLDGVVYVGPDAVPGVPQALADVRRSGMRLGFVTNNAARTPEDVAAHLTDLGVAADPADVITSSQAAATVVAELLGPGARVLPVGGAGVAAALRAAGLTVVERAEDGPDAVVQGYGKEVGWAQLAEAVVAVRNGARHVATNTDATIPSPRGPLPGNGAMVGVVSAVTGLGPLVTGKPDPAMHAECVRRTDARRPLVVGDRLDTDIEGARRAGAPSLLVLSGVTDPATLLAAGPDHRPDHLSHDASGLLLAHPPVTSNGTAWRCGVWEARPGEAGAILLARVADDGQTGEGGDGATGGLDGLRALCVAHWSRHPDDGAQARVVADDAAATAVLDGWGLTGG